MGMVTSRALYDRGKGRRVNAIKLKSLMEEVDMSMPGPVDDPLRFLSR